MNGLQISKTKQIVDMAEFKSKNQKNKTSQIAGKPYFIRTAEDGT